MPRYLVALRKEATYAEYVTAKSKSDAEDAATVLIENGDAQPTTSEITVGYIIRVRSAGARRTR